MERQSSFGSQGSGRSSATNIIKDAQNHGQSEENQNANNGFTTTALFGVLFTLAKEKYSDSWKVAILTVIVDFFLILAIMFNLEYPWAVDPHNGVFKFFYMIEIHKPLSTLGYKGYTIVFYLLSAMLYLTVGICVWVAWCFKNDSFPYLWPIKFVRIVASLFFGMLYIAALNIFLVIIECAPDHGVWSQHIWHVQCLTMPHIIHATFSVLSCVIFAVAALLLVIADHELQPMTRSLLAAPHSMTELKAQLAKTVITVVDVLLWMFPKVQGVVFAICTGATFYFHLRQLPYYTSWINSFRLCFFAVHAWVGLHLGVLVFTVESKVIKKGSLGFIQWKTENVQTAEMITNSMIYGLPVVFVGAGLLGAMRLYYFFRVALKFQILQQQPNLNSKRVHRFNDDKEVEVCSRIARVWDEDGNLDMQCLDLAEVILRAGIQQFPKSPYLHIVYANLLIECRQQLQSGWSQLEEAHRMPLNLSYRFSIFTREQEHKQKAAVSSSGESAADLVSYVEFQRNYRMIQSYHKAALAAMREFWRLLLYDAVNMNSLTSAFRKIEMMERLADRTYKVVLERYPKAVKLLRSYALFLETVKNDPWTAAQFYTEAEKQEESLENAEHDMAGEESLTIRNSAIVTINAMGIIQMANKHAIKMLGYAKGELEGKNVSCLMPQPFSSRHNTYMRNHVTTGKAKILDDLREVVALHRDRYVFPIKILVTKSQGSGADAIFMGLLKEVEADANQIKAWLMPNGVTLCADQSFTDYAGWAPNDLIGKSFSSIAVDPAVVDALLDRAMKANEHELKEGAVQMDVMLNHKFAEEVPVTIRVELGGTSDQRLLVLNMTRVGEVVPIMVLDHHGRVLFANLALCSLLGTKPKDIRGRDLGTLMLQPFGYLHHRWMKDVESEVASHRPPPSSCRAGAVHSLLSSNGVHVPLRMVISSRELPGGVHVHIMRARRVTLNDALDEQRLNITIDQHGHIISVSSAHHAAHGFSGLGLPAPDETAALASEPAISGPQPQVFGYAPENLVGGKLYEAVDMFQEWHSRGHSVMQAVKALVQHSAARPGSAWRVGVLPHYQPLDVEKGLAKLGKTGEGSAADEVQQGLPPERLLSRRRSMRSSATMLHNPQPKWRAAIMQVMGPEHAATGTHYTIKLWRPEMLTGVIEINEKMVVVRGDSAAGLIFGVPSYTISQQPLSRFLKLGPPGANSPHKLPGVAGPGAGSSGPETHGSPGAKAAAAFLSKESLLGYKHVKGGMKGGKLAHKTGPRRVFEARHADGMPLQISFQVALKNGTSTSHLIAAIKPLNLIKGNVAVLYAAMRGEDFDHFTTEDVPSRALNRLRTHTSQNNGAMAAAAAKEVSATLRRQATSKLGGDASAAMEPSAAPLSKAQSRVSDRAMTHKNAAPGMYSTKTLGAGSLVIRGDDTMNLTKLKGTGKHPADDPYSTPGGRAADEIRCSTDSKDMLATSRDIQLKLGAQPALWADGKKDIAEAASPGTPERPGSDGLVKDGKAMARASDSPACSDGNMLPMSDKAMVQSESGAQLSQPPPPPPQQQQQQTAAHMAGGGKSTNGRQQQPQQLLQNQVTRRRSSEEQGEEGSVRLHHHHHHHHSRQQSRRDWDHVLHVDPEEVPIPHDVDFDIEHHWGDEKDMTVSSSSSSHDDDGSNSESDKHVGRNTAGAADKMTREEALQRKKTMATLEPSERVQYVKGVRRVKEWLASAYRFDRRDAEPIDTEVHRNLVASVSNPWRSSASRQLSRVLDEKEARGRAQSPRPGHLHKHGSGAGGTQAAVAVVQADVLDPDDQLMTLDELAAEVEQHEDDGSEEVDEGSEAGGGGGEKESGRAHSHAATAGGSARGRHTDSVGGAGGKDDASSFTGGHAAVGSSGMNRGRRLKRLLKLLSGQKVSRGVSRLRMHVLVVIGAIMLMHTVCFMLVIIYINKQKQFITEISAAGEALDRSFFTAMYTRSIEAATRSAGFSSDDISSLHTRLSADVDRLEILHQGLYLGFHGLSRSTSTRLNNLWDLKQWNVTQYQDTKTPSFKFIMTTLWNLGNDFIAAVREVAFDAANNKLLFQSADAAAALTVSLNGTSPPPPVVTGVGVTSNAVLTLNRFWLFIRDNVGEGLYTGYLRVLDTLLLLAQDNITMLKLLIITLLVLEGCLICFASIGYMFWLLWKATRTRAALFTVFLVIPQGQLRALASRHITTAQSDDESEDEGTGKSKAKHDDTHGDGADDQISDGASILSGGAAMTGLAGGGRGGGGGYVRRSASFTELKARTSTSGSTTGAQGRKGITFKEHPKRKNHRQQQGQSETMLTRLRHAMSGEMTVPAMEKAGRTRRFFTKKRLTHTTSDIKHLAWPFFAWGAIIVAIYLVSYLQFAGVEESLVNLKMFERSAAQAARTMYYMNELALEADPTRKALLQPIVASEASWLDTVYSTTLYGGRTLDDSAQLGAHDNNVGSLFVAEHHAEMLFSSQACLRSAMQTCVAQSDRFYEVTRHAIDPMMRRLIQEATLLSLDDLVDVNQSSSRWQYMWMVAQQDMHDGLEALVSSYKEDSLAAFKAQGTLHIVVFAIAWVLWALYLWLLLKPYLQISSTETKRVAEMLSQLPVELDVEGMVEESWLVVANTQLEKSAPKVPGKRLSVADMAMSVIAAVHMVSVNAAQRISGSTIGGGAAASADPPSLLDADNEDVADTSVDAPRVKSREWSPNSDGVQSLFSNKLTAALKGVGGAEGDGSAEGDGDEDGNGTGDATGGLKSSHLKRRQGSGDFDVASQTNVWSSRISSPSGVAAAATVPLLGQGSTASPVDAAKVPSRLHSGADGVSPRSPSLPDAVGASSSLRMGDRGKPRPSAGRRSGRVVPLVGSPTDSLEQPGLQQAFGAPPALATVPEVEDSDHAKVKEAPSPSHYKIVSIGLNNDQLWSADEPCQLPVEASVAPPRPSFDRASAGLPADGSQSSGAGDVRNEDGGGDGADAVAGGRSNSASNSPFTMASPMIASVAPAAAGSAAAQGLTLLPGEVDDTRMLTGRVGSMTGNTQGLDVPTASSGWPTSPRTTLAATAAVASSGGSSRDANSHRLGTPTPRSPATSVAAPGSSRVGALMPATPPSFLGSPMVVGALGAAVGSRLGTPTTAGTPPVQSPAPRRLSVDSGSHPLSVLSRTAANIDLPPPPTFSHTNSVARTTATATASEPLAELASLNAAAAAIVTTVVPVTAGDDQRQSVSSEARRERKPTSRQSPRIALTTGDGSSGVEKCGSKPTSSLVIEGADNAGTAMAEKTKVDLEVADNCDIISTAASVSRPGTSSSRSPSAEADVVSSPTVTGLAAAVARRGSKIRTGSSPLLAIPSQPVQEPPS